MIFLIMKRSRKKILLYKILKINFIVFQLNIQIKTWQFIQILEYKIQKIMKMHNKMNKKDDDDFLYLDNIKQ